MQEPVVPLTIVRARAIGGVKMREDKGDDDKILAVAFAVAPTLRRDRVVSKSAQQCAARDMSG